MVGRQEGTLAPAERDRRGVGVKLIIATPVDGAETFTARVTVGYHSAVKRLVSELGAECLPAELLFGEDVGRARNLAVAMILRDYPSADYVLWLDDDTWPEDIGCVARMAATGEHIIGAPYTTKRGPPRWVHQLLTPCPVAVNDVQAVKFLGFGCTLTSLVCLKKMYAASRRYTAYPTDIVAAD